MQRTNAQGPQGPTRRNTAKRLGFSLIELLMVITIVGIILMMAVPQLNAVGRSASLRSSRDQLGAYLATARATAVQRGTTAQFRRSGNYMYVTANRTATQLDTILQPFPLDAEQHVTITATPADTVAFNSRGAAVGLGTAGAKFIVARDGWSDSVCVTKLGSILDRSCGL
ncbi:MAG: hypothetical protein NVS4B3_09690 [Gemmatimonadaceae bacterium]